MDPANISWLDSDSTDSYWEADNRRDSTEGDSCIRWLLASIRLSEMSRYYQEIGDDLGRRERMAEACYDV